MHCFILWTLRDGMPRNMGMIRAADINEANRLAISMHGASTVAINWRYSTDAARKEAIDRSSEADANAAAAVT